jgi:polyhydroxyalkanoate synthase
VIAAAVALSAIVLGLVVAAVLHYRYWTKRLTVPLEYVDEETIATPDGSAIELRRIPPLRERSDGTAVPAPEKIPEALAQPPVLLVHGIGINHQNNDVLPDLSLARHLAAEGRDCWLLTLRTGRAAPRRERGLMRFSPMAKHDLPIGIARVLARTGAPGLDYVGFSMGGMLLYASLGLTVPPESIRKVVVVGSPAVIRAPWPLALFTMLHFLPWWAIPTVPLRMLSRMVAFAAEWIRTPFHRYVYNPENVERGIAGASLMTIQDVPSALSLDFARWARRGGMIDLDGGPIAPRLEALRTPVMFFAGAADRIAPPDAVRAAYEAWGRAHGDAIDKKLVVLGREHGAAGDYGHGDLAIGRHAREDLFVPIAEFLAR